MFKTVLNFGHLIFEFVSNFEFRICDLVIKDHTNFLGNHICNAHDYA
jgi:hypothetical protein